MVVFKTLKGLSHHRHPNSAFQTLRTFIDTAVINYTRDRGLEHAVEREKDLKPILNLKNLIKTQPSKSLPLSVIVESKDLLSIPYRPIDFIRKYPLIFQEYFPANLGIHPHLRLTPQILHLDAEEQLVFDSDSLQKGAADRLLRLLMLCRVNEIPLKLIDRLKWDLGLPHNYVSTLVPQFPDYFQVKRIQGSDTDMLELVCWSDEMAVSVLEKNAFKGGYRKGMPLAFPMLFSKGFELDKKLKKWIDDWQRLPYVSPYENASHLLPNSDESDKWATAVLHEFLNILVSKKTERENVLCFGEYLGIRSRLKRALVHHPGVFYLSSKIGTYTVVLREGFKRGLLIEKHPLMNLRSKYIHLMHTEKEVQKPKAVSPSSISKQQVVKEAVGKDKHDGGKVNEQGDELCLSESGFGDENGVEVEVEEENESSRGGLRSGRRRSSKSIVDRRKGRRSSLSERSHKKYLLKT